jgi:salicylate 1-O-methyltransferase
MWLSRVPMPIPGHFYIARSGGETRAAFERQAAQDWERFLSLRSKELRPGGRLVLSVPGGHHDGSTGFEELMDLANATLADMVAEGVVATDERDRMVHGALLRPLRDLLAPFAREPHFAGLTVEHSEVNPVPDAAWAAFEQDGGKEALANARTSFFRVTYAPTLAGALANAGDAERRCAFYDRLEFGLKRRLLNAPTPIKSLIATMVLAKVGAEWRLLGKRNVEADVRPRHVEVPGSFVDSPNRLLNRRRRNAKQPRIGRTEFED